MGSKISAWGMCTPQSSARSARFHRLAPDGNLLLAPNAYADNYSLVYVEKSRLSTKSRIYCAFLCALILCGCAAKPQVIKEVVYIDKPCDRARDAAPSVWLPIRWIAVTIDSVGYTATPDGELMPNVQADLQNLIDTFAKRLLK